MGALGDAIGRNGQQPPALGPRRSGVPAGVADATGAPMGNLAARRDALAAEVAELHWDLGGLAYEMAIRDHFRLDVLVRRAAVLQERDAELAEIERLLRMEQGGAAGSCPSCGAPHSRGAIFCWQCGARLMEKLASTVVAGRDGTAPMDELLGADAADGAER